MLVGNGVPYRARYRPGVQELGTWKRHLAELAARARTALDMRQALDLVRHPAWKWNIPQNSAAIPPQNDATFAGEKVQPVSMTV
jgi:hypothetical protein